jgi:hypothetical protein
MLKPNGRPQKYKTADDLFHNCARRDDCYIWPDKVTMTMPMLAPASPLSKLFGTTSVARILFTICRFPPASTRIVRWCNTRFCVNPYHHTEAGAFVKERRASDLPTALLPSQLESRHLVAPPDDVLETLKPSDPVILRHLAETAARAGFDCKGIPDHRHTNAFKPKHMINAETIYADPTVPVLVMRSMTLPRPVEPAGVEEFSFGDIEAKLDGLVAKTPVQKSKEPEVQHVDSKDDSIFAAIRRRDEYLRAQQRKAEHGG